MQDKTVEKVKDNNSQENVIKQINNTGRVILNPIPIRPYTYLSTTVTPHNTPASSPMPKAHINMTNTADQINKKLEAIVEEDLNEDKAKCGISL